MATQALMRFFYADDSAITGERLMSDERNEDNKTTGTDIEMSTGSKAADDSAHKTSKSSDDISSKAEEKSAFDNSDNAKFNESQKEYFQELREENKYFRLKAKELEEKVNANSSNKNAHVDEATNLAKKALDKSNKLQSAIEKRLINSELQQLAAKEGLIDMDAFKMVDLSHVQLSEDGEVVGLDKVIENLKTNKPYLFKLSSNTNPNPKNPHATDEPAKRPTYETNADFEKARQGFLKSIA